MDCITFKSEIADTFSSVRKFSFEQKRSFLNEAKIRNLLDAVVDFKKVFNEKTEKIHSLNEEIEKLTWFNDLNDECLLLINDLISSIKDAHSTLIKQYSSLEFIHYRKNANEEITNFKNAIDDLKESYQDLESVFFFLPAMPVFNETTKQLSLI